MMDYEKISREIDLLPNMKERNDYCEKILEQIENESNREDELLINSPPSRNLLLEAVERGEIQFNEEMVKKRMELWEKCYDVVIEFRRMRLFNCNHFYDDNKNKRKYVRVEKIE